MLLMVCVGLKTHIWTRVTYRGSMHNRPVSNFVNGPNFVRLAEEQRNGTSNYLHAMTNYNFSAINSSGKKSLTKQVCHRDRANLKHG